MEFSQSDYQLCGSEQGQVVFLRSIFGCSLGKELVSFGRVVMEHGRTYSLTIFSPRELTWGEQQGIINELTRIVEDITTPTPKTAPTLPVEWTEFDKNLAKALKVQL